MRKEQNQENSNGEEAAGSQPEGRDNLQDINVDENMTGTSHLNEQLDQDRATRLERELLEMKEKYLRLVAEFDNFKKRNARERIDLIQTANRDVVSALLDILDDSDRAGAQLQQSGQAEQAREGVLLVFNKLNSVLQSQGLKEMDTLHKPFNPDLQEAILEIPAPAEDLKGKVLDILQKGYYLNDKIIRHARVVVGK